MLLLPPTLRRITGRRPGQRSANFSRISVVEGKAVAVFKVGEATYWPIADYLLCEGGSGVMAQAGMTMFDIFGLVSLALARRGVRIFVS